MRIHYLQHGIYETPGIIQSWADSHNYQINGTRVDLNEQLPIVDDFDFLILLGGPSSLRQLKILQTFAAEIALLQRTYTANKPVLGICLGAQLIAESLGAKTQASPFPEIGVFPVTIHHDAATDPVFSLYPPTILALHLHYDMFSLPKGATLLASSAGCSQQAFRFGKKVYGIQYHLEKTQENVNQIIEFYDDFQISGPYVASKAELSQYQEHEVNQFLFSLLDYLVQNCLEK